MNSVSVVVPTYERPRELNLLLESLTRLPVLEVLVCDDGSGPAVAEVVRNWADKLPLQHLRHERNGERAAAARNLGVRVARGESILFLDDDVIVSPDLLDQYRRHWQSGPGLWFGMRRRTAHWPPQGEAPDDPRIHEELGPDFPLWARVYTCNCLANRPCVEFDESFVGWGNEDSEWAYRMQKSGAPLILCKDVEVWHLDAEVPRDPGQCTLQRKPANYGPYVINLLRMAQKYPQESMLRRDLWIFCSRLEVREDGIGTARKVGNPAPVLRWAEAQLAAAGGAASP